MLLLTFTGPVLVLLLNLETILSSPVFSVLFLWLVIARVPQPSPQVLSGKSGLVLLLLTLPSPVSVLFFNLETILSSPLFSVPFLYLVIDRIPQSCTSVLLGKSGLVLFIAHVAQSSFGSVS